MRDWADALNAWKDQQLSDFEHRPGWWLEDGVHRRGRDRLLDYGCPGGTSRVRLPTADNGEFVC